MCEFFEESVRETLVCLNEHVQKCIDLGVAIKSIFLVGGLGSSEYLRNRMREYVTRLPGNVEVIKPRDAEFAVIRGAITTHQKNLLQTDEDPVTVRICPASYGLRVNQVWNHSKHDPNIDASHIHALTGKKMAENQIFWLIKKGDKIEGKKIAQIKEDFERNFSKCPVVWEDPIVTCSLDNPPTRMTPDVKVLCRLNSDMRREPLSVFEQKKVGEFSCFSKRKKYYHCRYDILMKFGLTDVEFEMIYRGRVRSELLRVAWNYEGILDGPTA